MLNCLDKIRKCLVTSQTEHNDPHDSVSAAGPTSAAGIRGGDAVGGNAVSNSPDGEAGSGSATGGDIEISSPSSRGGIPLVGGSGTGGSATGKKVIGGKAVGGRLRWAWWSTQGPYSCGSSHI